MFQLRSLQHALAELDRRIATLEQRIAALEIQTKRDKRAETSGLKVQRERMRKGGWIEQ